MLELMLLLGGCPAGTDSTGETGKDTADTGDSEETGVDSVDTGDTVDTVDSADTVDTVDTVDTEETAVQDPCPDGAVVTFVPDVGEPLDVTNELLTGTYLTLDQPGTLSVCPGTWFARILVRANVNVVGLGAAPEDTVLSAGELGTILDTKGPDVTMTVENVTLDRGAGLDVDHNSGGGGIYCDSYGAVVADRVHFTNNFANDGAGLYVSDCEVTVSHSLFEDNFSEDDGGSFTMWYSNGTLDDVTFRSNTGLDGGAMALFWGTATLTNVTFEDNEATFRAGAAWFYKMDVVVTDSVFQNNQAAGEQAGAVELDGTGLFERDEFSGNGSSSRGGGIYLYWETTLDATDCTLADNVPDDLWVSDYSEATGVAYTVGGEVDFSCASNVCTGL